MKIAKIQFVLRFERKNVLSKVSGEAKSPKQNLDLKEKTQIQDHELIPPKLLIIQN
ncbi:hypothetical protein KFK09_016893 [Dendrobium nobile]|uniref:Uncharacterized protein n=1 Tax=Dendrobium nobile TaxID=94219 RepID=A0A8T3B1D4_DENNO|nr:hypothetical protein KFK09_016893 [Dendrobium nobile]